MGVKKQMVNMQAQLEHIGLCLSRFSKLGFNACNNIETIGMEYIDAMRDMDIQQNCNKYVWGGLPKNQTSWLIEHKLYNRSYLAGFITGGILYILPGAMTDPNIDGIPTKYTPVTYNGQSAGGVADNMLPKKLLINLNGTPSKDPQAVILYDRVPTFNAGGSPIARAVLNNNLIEYQADILARVKNNLKNTDKKIVFEVETEAQADSMRHDLREAYGTSDPFIVVTKGTNELQGQALQTGVDVITQSLFETYQSINSIRCMCSGLSNEGAFEKKERKITGELEGDEAQSDLILDAGLRMRRLWLQQMKDAYPEYADMLNKITVDINPALKRKREGNEYDYIDTDIQI